MKKNWKSLIALTMASVILISQGNFTNIVKADDTKEETTQNEIDYTQAPPLLVTEVVADNPSGKRYTYTEVYNNSDAPINFSDYVYYYCYTGGMGSGKIFGDKSKVGDAYQSLYVGDYSTKDVVIEPGKTLVLWQNEKPQKAGYTLDDFNKYYGTNLEEGKDIISVPYTGIHDSAKRGFFFGTDENSIVVKAWSNEAKDEIPKSNPDKLGMQYEYTGEKNTCTMTGISKATPGEVSPEQVPAQRVHVNTSDIKITSTNASVDDEGNFNIEAEIPFEGTESAMFTTLYYRQKVDGLEPQYKQANLEYTGDGKTFKYQIPAKEMYANEVEWYIEVNNGGHKDHTEINKTAVTPKLPSDENATPIYITEAACNEKSSEDDGQYSYFEIYNQSDKAINLAYYKILYYYEYPAKTAAQSGKTWSVQNIDGVIEPGKTMVVWLTSNGTTLEQFNNRFGTDLVEGKDIVKVNYSGLHSSEPRWIRFGTSEDDAMTVAGFNTNAGQLTKVGEALQYAAPHGDNSDYSDPFRNESIPVAVTKATPGTVEDWQVTNQKVTFKGYTNYPEDDGKAPTLKICPDENLPVPSSINEGDILKVMYETDLLMGATGAARVDAFKDFVDESNPNNTPGGSERLKKRPYMIGTEILYKLDNETEWNKISEKKQWRLGHYLMQIPADILFGHKKVTFKVRAYTLYGMSETEENTVKINGIQNETGKIRLNVKDDDIVSGVKTITANDGKDNGNVSIKLNDEAQNLEKMLEDGAYFMIKTSGMDTYFKNAITAPYNGNQRDIITILSPWCESTLSRAVKIDNKYITYNKDTDSFDVQLTVWAGDSGTPFEEALYPEVFGENHEDYTVSGLQLKLANGKSYIPTKIEPDNVKTNTDTSLDAWHTIGDSAGMETHLTATFSIPAADATAVGFNLDTTKLKDGAYTIVAENGNQDERMEASIIVDNTKPEINLGIKDGDTISKSVMLEEADIAKDTSGISNIAVTLDGENIELPAVINPDELKNGEHILAVAATDIAGNIETKTVKFTSKKSNTKVSDDKNESISDISANLTVSVGDENADVTFLKGKSLTTANNGIEEGNVTETGNTGENPYQLFTVNTGKVSKDDVVSVKWNGKADNTDENHLLSMFALDVNNNKWKLIGTADENGNIDTQISADKYVDNGKATVLVQVVTKGTTPKIKKSEIKKQQKETMSNWDGTSRPENYDFALAWETDTQYYSESFPYHYDNVNKWIADNAEDWKIKYVLHTGDIVDDVDMTGEWINADKSMKILDDAEIPYGVLGGNHDVYAGAEGYGNYWKYFGEDRFKNKDYYGGSYKNNLGHYDLITENGQDLLILYMSWDIYTNEIQWMNEVLAKYPDRKAIIALHRYSNVKMTGDNSILDYAGKLLQTEVVAKNPNVIAVLNGHYHGSSIQVDGFDDNGDGIKERTVYQICTDYQSDPEGGSEYIKFLYFDLNNNKIYVNSYSPYRNDFNYYDNAKLESYGQGTTKLDQDIAELEYKYVNTNKSLQTKSISADLRTNEKIGSVSNAKGKVTYKWTNLNADSEYSWYAKVVNGNGTIAYTNVNTFKTNKKNVISDDNNNVKPGNDKKNNTTVKPGNNTKTVNIGEVYKVGNLKYRVKSIVNKNATLEVVGVRSKSLKTVNIPGMVTINGVSGKVTAIGNNAFKGCKKLKKVSINSVYLTTIGKSAFGNCKKLKKVVIKSKKLKKVGKKAFFKISKKSVIKVPAAKKKTYKKILGRKVK